MDVQGQLEKMAHDITSGPAISDSLSIAIMGGAIGGLIGYLKDRDSKGAKSFALWGAGLGIAGQYMLFHALKPALKTFGRTAHGAAQGAPVMQMVPRYAARGGFVGNGSSDGYRPPEKCPDGFHWENRSTGGPGIHGVMVCVPDVAPPTPPTTTAWGHGEMMGAVPYPYYYAWWE